MTFPCAGGRFVYRYRYDAAGKRVTEYIGATSDPATHEKIEQARAEISELASIAEHSRNLRRIGYHSADNSTVVTVASLFNAGVFGGGGAKRAMALLEDNSPEALKLLESLA